MQRKESSRNKKSNKIDDSSNVLVEDYLETNLAINLLMIYSNHFTIHHYLLLFNSVILEGYYSSPFPSLVMISYQKTLVFKKRIIGKREATSLREVIVTKSYIYGRKKIISHLLETAKIPRIIQNFCSFQSTSIKRLNFIIIQLVLLFPALMFQYIRHPLAVYLYNVLEYHFIKHTLYNFNISGAFLLTIPYKQSIHRYNSSQENRNDHGHVGAN